ncbi:hypothetical protein ABZP36_018059 [Zizania latifolia]
MLGKSIVSSILACSSITSITSLCRSALQYYSRTSSTTSSTSAATADTQASRSGDATSGLPSNHASIWHNNSSAVLQSSRFDAAMLGIGETDGVAGAEGLVSIRQG